MDKQYFEKCKNRVNSLTDRAIRVNASFGILRQIQEFQYSENEIINVSHNFYRIVIINFIETLFIEIHKMFEDNRESDSIVVLFKELQKNADKFEVKPFSSNIFESMFDNHAKEHRYDSIENMIEFWLDKINDSKKLIESVKNQRDKYYAHLDKMSDDRLSNILKKYEVTYSDMLSLLTLNMNMCNAVYSFFNETTVFPMLFDYDDLKNTINYLIKYKEKTTDYA